VLLSVVLASPLALCGCGEEESMDYNMTPVEQEEMIQDDLEMQRSLTTGR